MTTAAQEATAKAYQSLEILSRGLMKIASGVYSAEQAQTIAASALYESAELYKDKEAKQ